MKKFNPVKLMLVGALCAVSLGSATAFAGCGAEKTAQLTDTYYYKVAFNHMSGEYMGVNLSNELIRTESESIMLYDDNTFVISFTSSLIGTISGDHDTGFVYQEQMYESATLTGTYEVKSEDSLMNTKTITLTGYTALQHNNVAQSFDNPETNDITFILTENYDVKINTETTLLEQLIEFYDGQYIASNTSY